MKGETHGNEGSNGWIGIYIPKTGFGMNVVSGSYLKLRDSKSQTPILIGLADAFSLGEKSSTVVLGHIAPEKLILNHRVFRLRTRKSVEY